MRYALSPAGAGLLLNMVSNSGKFLNNMGNIDACLDNELTEFAVFGIQGLPTKFNIALCVPAP